MPLSAFDDGSHQPSDEQLQATLGPAYARWNQLKELIAARFPPVTEVWNFAGKSIGWGLRLKQEERIILYMIPGQGRFLTGFVLGERSVEAARSSKLPESILAAIDGGKKYAEGRGIRFETRTAADVRNMEKLAIAKMTV